MLTAVTLAARQCPAARLVPALSALVCDLFWIKSLIKIWDISNNIDRTCII